MKLGVISILNAVRSPYEELAKVRNFGFDTCQLVCWDMKLMTDEYAEMVKKAAVESEVEITAFWCGWPKPAAWNFYDGPLTLGLVPSAYRHARIEALVKGSEFASKAGISDVITHAGFIPENPNDPEYMNTVAAVRYIARSCRDKGQGFLFETGQETPVALIRMIEDTGLDNLGVNLDPANLLMYGKANPTDSIDLLGKYIRGVHAKDGEYPNDGRSLGEEKPLGRGKVNFPLLIDKLKKCGYDGALTIEREIEGDLQVKDIMAAKEMLEKLI